jgi:proline iminopeptidase
VPDLYPELEARVSTLIDVGDRHRVYVEESGNPEGRPVVFLHGGPGGATTPTHRRFFDPDAYRIVLFDQRGCGRSTPFASTEHNTTWDLVRDIETIREHFGVTRWTVFGGSWGATLALAYAERHPEAVSELVLRGVFLGRRAEIDWLYQEGASNLFPDAWEQFVAPIPVGERDDLLGAYHRRLNGSDPTEQRRAARAWTDWEHSLSSLGLAPEEPMPDDAALAMARIESHYFVHGAFLARESQLLDDVGRIRHLPAVIVQGRYDVVCPVRNAWDLHRAWPEAELVVNPHAGHSARDPENASALVDATDRFRTMERAR